MKRLKNKPAKKQTKQTAESSRKPAPIKPIRALSPPGRQRDIPLKHLKNDPEVKALLDVLNHGKESAEPAAAELDLSAAAAPVSREERQLWQRGKLAGEKLVKTNKQTGEVVVIKRDEWNQLY